MKILMPLCAVIAVAIAACNNVGTCPSTITPGGSCSGDNLTCAYTIKSGSAACSSIAVDGSVATSCTCTSGAWVCPSCGDDGGGGDDAAVEAAPDAPAETSSEASMQTDGGAEAGDAAHD